MIYNRWLKIKNWFKLGYFQCFTYMISSFEKFLQERIQLSRFYVAIS